MPYNPNRHSSIFGSTFLKDLSEHHMLVIGRDTWTRVECAKMGVVQTRACSILTGIAKRLKVDSLKELYETTSPYSFAEFPAGVTTLYVLFAAFYDRDLDPDAWYKAGKEAALVTFITLKDRELKAAERTRQDEKSRQKQARRAKHERDVKTIINGVKNGREATR